MLQRNGDVPLYLQVKDQLLKRILDGDYPPGASLPAEPDLCEQFGVSRGTVRQALGVLERDGFVSREQGRGTFVLVGGKREGSSSSVSRQIGFVVPYVRDSFISTILLGVERAASEYDLSVMFKHADNSLTRQDEVLAELQDQNVAGIILYPVSSGSDGLALRLLDARYPLVLVDRYLRGTAANYVMSDHFGGAMRATQHLIALGHRQIGFVSWRNPAISLEHRSAGYRQALAEVGLASDPALTCEVEEASSTAIEPLCDFLSAQMGRMTAIFAANDQLALAVYKAARQLRIRIPDDLALVGFDNLDFTMHLDVPLTTVEQSATEIGRQAVAVLVRHIEDPAAAPEQIILPTRLIVRRSCGAHLVHAPDVRAAAE